MADWQSIETAPKDGTSILLYSERSRYRWVVGKWVGNFGEWQSQPGAWPMRPTHWKPLEPPMEVGRTTSVGRNEE